MTRYSYRSFPYVTPPELSGAAPFDAQVIIVGAGPVGLAAAVDLALHGIRSIVLDGKDVVSRGSRAICWSKRTLEIFNRLGIGRRMREKGVTWQVGRVFRGDNEIYNFNLLVEDGHEMPAFVNLQQYYVEEYLVARAADFPDLIDLRWRNRVIAVSQSRDRAIADIETPDGAYRLEAPYLLACDGARSPVRHMLRLDFSGQGFPERFLIADVEMKADFPPERHFWFEPSFHPGQSALIHKQPDDIYRIDFQLSADVDPQEEVKPERVLPRVRAAVKDRPFTLDWVSIYTFQCRRLERFIHERIIFVGDAAHVMSPFGARGGNGGIQDVDNLGWKLAHVLKGEARQALLDTYDEERCHGADENLRHSARATTFMTPRTGAEHHFRDAVLDLSTTHAFARRLLNSGRLSQPCSLEGLRLQTPAQPDGGLAPGVACPDAPVSAPGGCSEDYLLRHLGGRFCLLAIDDPIPEPPQGLDVVMVGDKCRLRDTSGLVAARYGSSVSYLIRPDQHIAARFQQPQSGEITQALHRALAGAP